jgi:hypothetical protein
MRAGVKAVKAKCAILVAGFPRQVQLQLAPSLRVASANAFVRRTGPAYVQAARLHLDWRDKRLYKIKLTDGADILAEDRSLEQSVNDKRCDKVADDYPSG